MKFFSLRRDEIKYIALILGLALLARIIYLVQLQDSIFFGNYILDGKVLDSWAKDIASGNFWGDKAFFRAPLYPYIVALFYKVFGPIPLPIILFQNLLGIVTVLLTFFYARYLLGNKVALIAGVVMAVWPTLIYFEGELMITALGVLLSLSGLIALNLAIDSNNGKKYFVAGIILGLAAITRPTVLPIILIIPIVFLFSKKKDKYQKLIRYGLICLVGLAIPIIPVTIRNVIVAGDFVLISSQGGSNFYIGNSRYADGRTVVMPMSGTIYEQQVNDIIYSQSITLAKQRLGRDLKDSEVSTFWFKEALRDMSARPGRAVMLYFAKLFFFWHGQEIFNNKSLYMAGEYSGFMKLAIWKKVLNFPTGLLLPFMLVGIFLVLSEKKRMTVPLLYVLIFSLTIALFFVCARFRQPIMPVAIILAAYGIYRSIQLIRKKKPVLKSIVIVFVVGLVIFNLGGNIESIKNRSQFENILGTLYMQKKDFPNAIAHLNQSLQIAPDNRSAIGTLSYAYLQAGQLAEAEKTLHRGVAMFPRSSQLNYNLGNLYFQYGQPEAAKLYFWRTIELDARLPDPYMGLGMIYEQEGQLDSARQIYRMAIDNLPNFTPAQTRLNELDQR